MGRRGAVVSEDPNWAVKLFAAAGEDPVPDSLKIRKFHTELERVALDLAESRIEELESELAVLRSRVNELERVVRRAR